MPDLEG